MARDEEEAIDWSLESTDSKKERSLGPQISYSNIGSVSVHNHTYHVGSPTDPTSSSFEQHVEDFQDEEWTELNPNFGYFHNRRVAGRKYIFHGEQRDDITGTTPVVVKLLQNSDDSNRHAKVLKLLHHQNLVKMLHVDSCNLGHIKHISIALEKCREINLRDQVLANKKQGKSFDGISSLIYAKQLVDAVSYMHSENILHRDLRPCNVLLSLCERHLKITDFAMAVLTEDHKTCKISQNCSIRIDGYQPAEVIHRTVFTHLSEVFSLGLVLYFLWSNGGHPFGDDPDEWNINIKKNRNLKIDEMLIENASHAKELLMKMLQPRQDQRPSAQELTSFEIFRIKTEGGIPRGGSLGNLMSHEACADEKPKLRPHASPDEGKSINELVRWSAPDTISDISLEPKGFGNSSDIRQRPRISSESYRTHRRIMSNDRDYQRGRQRLPELELQNYTQLFNSLVIFDKILCVMRVYHPAFNKWTPMNRIHSDMATRTFTTVSSNGYVYLLSSDRIFLRVNASKSNAMWEYLPHMKHVHGDYPPAVTSGGKIYVIGAAGNEGCGMAHAAECFDPAQNCWSDLRMADSRHHHAVVVERGRIWCVGGQEDRTILNSVTCYDIYEEKWLSRPSMLYARAMPSSVYYQHKVFVLGGYLSCKFAPEMRTASVEHCDSKTLDWTTFRSMHKPRAAFTALIISGSIYSVGGDERAKGLHDRKNTIERYSHPEKKWCTINVKKEIKMDCMSATAVYSLP